MTNENNARGLTIVYTGHGKGKTTAALGLCLRAAGHGNKCIILQFIKSNWPYGELETIRPLFPEITMEQLGLGCVGILDDDRPKEEHRQAAVSGLQRARQVIAGGRWHLVVLDEIFIAVQLGFLSTRDILDLIDIKPDETTLVLTGRDADEEIIQRADTVTSMTEVKHHFQQGIVSVKGIDH